MTSSEQRFHPRYKADLPVHFHTPYIFHSEIDFGLGERPQQSSMPKQIGFSRDISVYGLSFTVSREIPLTTFLWMELHLPDSDHIIFLQGIVRWCHPATEQAGGDASWIVGIEVTTVDGISVEQTVYFDEKYNVYWSELLEHVLGGYAKLHKRAPKIEVLRGIMQDDQGRYLLLQRASTSKSFPGKWEFPGGKVAPGEKIMTALRREFLEETGFTIEPQQLFAELSFNHPDEQIHYRIFFVKRVSGVFARSFEHDNSGWFTPEQIKGMEVSSPLEEVMRKLLK